MPNSILSSIASALSGKVAFSATNELTGSQCWSLIKIKDVEIDSSSANTSNPVSNENAAESDTFTSLLSSDINSLKIIQPSRMRITAFCTDLSSLESIISTFEDTQATLTITTKGITANGLAIIDVDIEQTPEMMSAVKVIIELEQTAAPAGVGSFNPEQSQDESAYGISIQTPDSIKTTATDLYNKVSNFFRSN